MNYNGTGRFSGSSRRKDRTYLDMLLSGLRWTIVTAIISWLLALMLGSIVGVLRTLPSRSRSG